MYWNDLQGIYILCDLFCEFYHYHEYLYERFSNILYIVGKPKSVFSADQNSARSEIELYFFSIIYQSMSPVPNKSGL